MVGRDEVHVRGSEVIVDSRPSSQVEVGEGGGCTNREQRTKNRSASIHASPLTRREGKSRSQDRIEDENSVELNVDADVPLQANLMKINLFRVRVRVRASIVGDAPDPGSGSGCEMRCEVCDSEDVEARWSRSRW